MRSIRALLGFALGLVLGATVAYALIRWLLAQQREGQALSGAAPAALADLPGAFDQLERRLRRAVEEGRRAAEEARAELEADAFGRRAPDAEPGETVI